MFKNNCEKNCFSTASSTSFTTRANGARFVVDELGRERIPIGRISSRDARLLAEIRAARWHLERRERALQMALGWELRLLRFNFDGDAVLYFPHVSPE